MSNDAMMEKMHMKGSQRERFGFRKQSMLYPFSAIPVYIFSNERNVNKCFAYSDFLQEKKLWYET